jgi:hypothetical protein
MRIVALGVAVALIQSTAGLAQTSAPDPSTGNGLLDTCDSEAGSFRAGLCRGFIGGVAQVGSGERLICFPNEATNGQIADTVLKGLREHPEQRHLLSGVLILSYLGAAFPCPSK